MLAGPGDRVVASRHVEQPPGSPAAAAAVDELIGDVASWPVRAVGSVLVIEPREDLELARETLAVLADLGTLGGLVPPKAGGFEPVHSAHPSR
ncbi:hypothetical protein [Pseudofrankia asymbiotica]|uniref:Uncharacterized protein n=1 Tax=Pseudofrankia asymbiotica TaxID=1834516 RepID=A0A1V2I8B1_9ACTN|nr:hypothetical protein [Pseudofrankia asymbiotica]ONH27795.1 hypothetical protein BL253_21435 [Pseudofrankia asymbiotica]